jgi:hypothetical protein
MTVNRYLKRYISVIIVTFLAIGQISKPFLKNKSLIVALNFYDLLKQQSNYERWVNATGRSDTRYNSINSYAMLHVRYRLNMFGGKIDTEGRYDKKWGNRDQRGR